jgi:hypothetical protein
VTTSIELRPRGPYHLRMTVGAVRDGTLRLHDDGAELVFATPAGPAHARVVQRGDGTLRIGLEAPDAPSALDRLRFLLGVDDDIAPFLALAQRDPLLAGPVARARGLRASRADVRACARALAGQLVTFADPPHRARDRVPRAACAPGWCSRPSADIARLSAAGVRLRPGARRAAAPVRISALRLERLSATARRGRGGSCGSASSAMVGGEVLPARSRALRPWPRGRPRPVKALQLAAGRRAEADTAGCSPASGPAWRPACCAPRGGARQEQPAARTASA